MTPMSVIHRVEKEMQECWGSQYRPDPTRGERLWRKLYFVEFGEYP